MTMHSTNDSKMVERVNNLSKVERNQTCDAGCKGPFASFLRLS